MKAQMAITGRQYYLDWVRVLAMIGIFFFHNARFYDTFSDWHVRNATTNLGASMLVAFLSQFIMPLFFLVAGAGTFYALKSRNAGQFSLERVLRLLVPWVFGMLVIVVPQAYYDALSHGTTIEGNVFQIYYLYLTTSLAGLNMFHLWFLADLFIFSLIFLPLMVTWSGSQSLFARLAARIHKPYLFLPLFILALSILNIFLYPDGYWGNRDVGNFSLIAYAVFFVLGFVIFANSRIMEAVERLSWVLLGVGALALVAMVTVFYDTLTDIQSSFGSGAYAAAMLIQAVSTWCWLLAILGLAKKFLNKTNRFLVYSNEAVLPFYILHQTVIIVIGFYVVQWETGVGLKYLTIAVASLIAIMGIYELLVRRINVLRFLFGMKLMKKRPEKHPEVRASQIQAR